MALPNLHIPASDQTVDVSVVDTTGTIRDIPTRMALSPPVRGHDWLAAPTFAFFVRHPGLSRAVMFDLGIRKDWENLSPPLVAALKRRGWAISVERNVAEVLEQGGVRTSSIEAIIWSHHHFDHTGDPRTFPQTTALVVGPGFKKLLPGYPVNPDSTILESDLAGREVIELDFDSGRSGSHVYQPLSIGRFRALDYFGDGSFYLLDSPGHATGHLSALARLTTNPPSFALLAGDSIHHPGEIRPSKYLPIPQSILPDPFAPDPHPLESHYGCPGEVFLSLFARRGRPACGPVYEPARGEGSLHEDVDEAIRTAEKLQELDAHDSVFVAAAHDEALLDHIKFFPDGKVNEFVEHRWVRRVRWLFLRDFAAAVGKQDHELGRRHWGPEETVG